MVNKILSFLSKEISGLHQAAYLLGFFALLSQVLALVRDKLLAYYLGANISLDLYYAAFRIPDFLFITIGSLVSISVIIPFFVEEEKKGEVFVRKFLDSVFSIFLLLIIAASAVVYFLLPTILSKIFPGFSAQSESLIGLSRILLLSPILLGISNLFGSLTQSRNRFFIYALSPLLYNFGIILGIIFLYPNFGLQGLTWGVVLGALLHMAIQLPSLIHLKLLPKLTFAPDFKKVRQLIILSLPRTITLSINHIAIFFLLSLASLMSVGSVSVFSLAFNLQSVPLSIIGVSYSLAAFPTLSRLFSSGEKEKFFSEILSSARHIIFWSVPVMVFFIVLRAHLVRVILGAGKFDWTDTRLTAATLALFSISLVFQGLILLFVRGLYARGATGKPFYISIISGATIVFSSYIFVYLFNHIDSFRYFIESLFKVADLGGVEILMLAMGFTFGSILEGLLMWRQFARQNPNMNVILLRTFFQVFSASVIMGFVIYLALRAFDLIFSLEKFSGVFLQGFLSGICGIAAWIIVLRLLKNGELQEIRKAIHARFWKAKAISPDSQVV
ncbi:MAG TPA: lipid II flippase MurJ [Candidatus Paceibacterota bacterium]